jgi:hypothetical protein
MAVLTERRDGSTDVIVDRLGHADHFQSSIYELERDAEGAVASDCNQRIDSRTLGVRDHLMRQVTGRITPVRLKNRKCQRVAPVGCAKDGAAKMRDAAD